MLKYGEFLNEGIELVTEAGERMTKDKWQAAYDANGGAKNATEFFNSVKNMYGIDALSGPKEYARVNKAFKDIQFGSKAAVKTGTVKKVATPVAPKPMTVKSAPVATPPIPKGAFDTKAYLDKLRKARDLLNQAFRDAADIADDFSKVRKGRNISNITTPELMNLYNTVEGVKYVQPAIKAIDSLIWYANQIDSAVKAVEKADKK